MKTEMEIFRRALLEESARFDIELSSTALDALSFHYALLRKWNTRIRLTGTAEPARAAVELFADSLIAWKFARAVLGARADEEPVRLIDIGSGAGFPAIPIKIMEGRTHITLVDSKTKKISFIKTLVRELALSGIEVIRGRAEELAQKSERRGAYDLAFCRAVAAPEAACRLAMPFLKTGGSFINQTSALHTDDRGVSITEGAQDAAHVIGTTTGKTMCYTLSSVTGQRLVIQVKKTASPTKDMSKIPRKL